MRCSPFSLASLAVAAVAAATLATAAVSAGCSAQADMPPSTGPTLHLDQGANLPDLTAPAACTGTQTACGGGCVDTTSDPANCGGCGMACPTGQSCQDSACADAKSCPAGQTSCSGACVDPLTSSAHCGGCGKACPKGDTCVQGACQTGGMMGGGTAGCAATVKCLNACMDSTCQNACVAAASPTGKTLLQAVFACLGMACPSKNGGVCDSKAMGYDATKCDACFMAAQAMGGACDPSIQACLADGGMQMGCSGGKTSCGGACVDTMVDASNCGGCGGACPMGASCHAGMCISMPGADGGVGPGSDGGTGGGASCGATLDCLSACMNSGCDLACEKAASATAKQLEQTLFQCLDGACPSTGGAVCDSAAPGYDATKCDLCYSTAQDKGGKCQAPYDACVADGGMQTMCGAGKTLCGGACVDTATDVKHCGGCGTACKTGETCGGGKCVAAMSQKTGCNGAVNCLNLCKTGDTKCENACIANTTTQGKQLLGALFQCLDKTCPPVNGGVCDQASFFYSPTKCAACYNKAQGPNGKCYTKLTACEGNQP